ncbi:hypothetical protein WDW86_06955 [Bdellovibrionota bacterium FG-2]
MSVVEAKMHSGRVFKTDQEVLDTALNEFKSKRGVFVQEVVDVEGGFAFGERHFFQIHIDMSRWLRKVPGDWKYVAVIMSDLEQKLTYRGKIFVMSYQHIDTKLQVTFFKDFLNNQIEKIDEKLLRESVSELVNLLKRA